MTTKLAGHGINDSLVVGSQSLICGDSLEVMQNLPDQSADVIIIRLTSSVLNKVASNIALLAEETERILHADGSFIFIATDTNQQSWLSLDALSAMRNSFV